MSRGISPIGHFSISPEPIIDAHVKSPFYPIFRKLYCNLLKFCRDKESDWTVKNDAPHYGIKEHASVDVNSGFVLATTLTPTSASSPEASRPAGT
jgi:hypothetical protein